VLKPGGVAIISDFVRKRQYQAEFEKAGLKISPESRWSWENVSTSASDQGDEDGREKKKVEGSEISVGFTERGESGIAARRTSWLQDPAITLGSQR
jgi:hypothetical protein